MAGYFNILCAHHFSLVCQQLNFSINSQLSVYCDPDPLNKKGLSEIWLILVETHPDIHYKIHSLFQIVNIDVCNVCNVSLESSFNVNRIDF